MKPATTNIDLTNLAQDIKRKGKALGFQQLGITATNLEKDEAYLLNWLKTGRHGEMDYMEHHGVKRSRPEALVPGTIRIISARMDYLPADAAHPQETLNDPMYHVMPPAGITIRSFAINYRPSQIILKIPQASLVTAHLSIVPRSWKRH